ncbi:bacterial RNA polymerase inhibitor [Escherichia phage Penshu1]|uniref:Bacterial RNA polymerase inhibitor n=6 Tax=Kayfunavirus TaxID=2732686 RepID=A0A5B9NB28_9CAUD|nr:bacterial RNA polymerase inhibitor [Escherichia phage Penshu1]
MPGDVREDSQPGLHYIIQPMEGARFMTEVEKKYIVELEGRVQSFEVPVYAKSLEEATLKSQEYEDAGFVVGRIRPET